MDEMLTIVGGILLALFCLRMGAAFLDWLDTRTSRITDEEARRRARLTMEGRWPPATRRLISATEFMVSVIALSALWVASRYLR
jgi:hypothetical protein